MGLENMRHVISIRDVVNDTVHQFAPTYHDYVLYSNGGNKVLSLALAGNLARHLEHRIMIGIGRFLLGRHHFLCLQWRQQATCLR